MARRREFDPDQTKMAVAALVACVVQTMRETDPSFEKRFRAQLKNWYGTLKADKRTSGLDCLEPLIWCREMIAGDRP